MLTTAHHWGHDDVLRQARLRIQWVQTCTR